MKISVGRLRLRQRRRGGPSSHPREREHAACIATAAFTLAAVLTAASVLRAEPARLSVLMLGDDGHHRPADLAKLITPVLAKDGIDVTYTEDVERR